MEGVKSLLDFLGQFGYGPNDEQRPILGYTYEGRPVLANEDGTMATEESLTITNPQINKGQPTNIPSIWEGRGFDEGPASLIAMMSGKEFPSFKSIEEAKTAARARTQSLSKMLEAGRWWEGSIPVPVSKPWR
jgi:hypothetical protein